MRFQGYTHARAWYLLGCIVFLGLYLEPATAETPLAYAGDPHAIEKEINHRGAKAVLTEVYDEWDVWQAVLTNIAIGTQAWLHVAVLLRDASDAGTSEQLTLAVGEALGSSPTVVLSTALKVYSIPDICGTGCRRCSLQLL